MKFRQVIFLFLIFPIITSCIESSSNGDSEFIKVVIADRTFKIPRGYLDGRKAIGKDTESIFLEYSLPDFEVLPPHPEQRAARKELIMAGEMSGMLLEAARNRPPLAEMIDNQRNSGNLGDQTEKVYGLHKHEASTRGRSNWKPDDTYLELTADGIVRSFLRCSPPGKDKVPGCQHTFIDKGVLYRIRWPIGKLPNWKSQREKAVAFIDQFESTKPHKTGENNEQSISK